MNKKLILLFSFLLLLITGCNKKVEYKILEFSYNDNSYVLETYDHKIYLSSYIITDSSYTIKFNDQTYDSDSYFKLDPGSNKFIVDFGKEQISLIVNRNIKEEVVVKCKLMIFIPGDLINLTFDKGTVITEELLKPYIKDIPHYTFTGFSRDLPFTLYMDDTIRFNYKKIYYTVTLVEDGDKFVVETPYNANYDPYTPFKEDYEFLYWELDNEKFDGVVDRDITLIAKFRKVKFDLNFYMDGKKLDLTYKATLNEPLTNLPIYSKDNISFISWKMRGYTVSSKTIYTNNLGTKVDLVYEKVTYKDVVIDYGLGEKAYKCKVDNGKVKLPLALHEGYLVEGYYLDKYFKTKITTLDQAEALPKLYAKLELDSINSHGTVYLHRFNGCDSDYYDIVIFDSKTDILASLYWFKVGISLNENGSYYVSGIGKNGESISNIGSFDYCILAYTGSPYYEALSSKMIEVGDEVIMLGDYPSTNGEIFKAISFKEEEVNPDYLLIEEELNNRYGSLVEVTNKIDLVKEMKGYTLNWKSSLDTVIDNDGNITTPERTKRVTLSAYIGKDLIYSFTVTVRGKQNDHKVSSGYIYLGYDKVTQNAMDMLDIAYVAFLHIDKNGNFTNLNSVMTSTTNYILPKAKKSGTKVVISIQTTDNSSPGFSYLASTKETRQAFAKKILDVITTYHLDGVDIDWETPAKSEAHNFTLLIEELYTLIKAYDNNLLITAAIGGGKWQPPSYELNESSKYLDYINLMTYSMANSNGYLQNALYKSHNTLHSCSVEESIEIYDSYHVDRSKILVGIPFYGVCQTESDGIGSGTGKFTRSYSQTGINNLLKDKNYVRYFDEVSKVPYIYNKVEKILISYEDPVSIKYKIDYIYQENLGGIMYWQYGQDMNDILTNTIKKYI